MKLEPKQTRVSIDHLTITSDDRRLIDRKQIKMLPKLLIDYSYKGRRPTKSEYRNDSQVRSYEFFHEFQHKRTGNKVHIFVDRYNTEKFKTLYLPNITVKFFSSWENNLTYPDVVQVCNLLVGLFNVAFRVSYVHVAVDLYFDALGFGASSGSSGGSGNDDSDLTDRDDPFERVAGRIMSGRKVERKTCQKYPDTYFFHSPKSMFCLVVYNKKLQLLREKADGLSLVALAGLRECFVTRVESRFRLPHFVCGGTLDGLAVRDSSFIYPFHLRFLEPDRRKLRKLGLRARDYRGVCLSDVRDLLADIGVTNNFPYYLREIDSLAEPVKAALAGYRWEAKPEKYPLSVPELVIPKQRVVFVRH